MNIFPVLDPEGRAFLRRAAFRGAEEMGVFQLLEGYPQGLSAEELARLLGVGSRRLRALLDVLVLEKALKKTGRYSLLEKPPSQESLPPYGWGLIAEIIRQDSPLGAMQCRDEVCSRCHRHLSEAGAAAAKELAGILAQEGSDLLDAGGGAGTYAAAYLDAVPHARATLVDFSEAISLARQTLAHYGQRVRFVTGNLASADVGSGYSLAFMMNLLHLHPPAVCEILVSRIASALAPGGLLVIKDLWIDKERRASTSGILFALNMAIYTEGGNVYDATQISDWIIASGLAASEQLRLSSSPDSVVLIARKSGKWSGQTRNEERAAPEVMRFSVDFKCRSTVVSGDPTILRAAS